MIIEFDQAWYEIDPPALGIMPAAAESTAQAISVSV